MNKFAIGKLLLAFALLFVFASNTSTASALERVEKRGDFWYDAEGTFVSVKQVEPPEDFPRANTSWHEKNLALGINLPPRSAVLQARYVLPKRTFVDDSEYLELDKLIVKFTEADPVRLRNGELTIRGGYLPSVTAALSQYPDVKVRRLHQMEERILDENKDSGERISGKALPDLNNFYLFSFPEKSMANADLANEILKLDSVELAYFQAPAETPACANETNGTPLWEASQFYRDPAPAGVDIEAAWAYDNGGNGGGSNFWIVDCEWAWCFDHEDLDIQVGDVLNGSTVGTFTTDHGSAVLGIIAACDNDYGVTGLTPDVNLKVSDFDTDATIAETVQTGVNNLLMGEIALMEIHIFGPDPGTTCPCNCTFFRYIPVEWDGATFAVLQTATANGIIIVEAGGNGSMDLDDAVYGGAFNRNLLDSGAIIVGAADPGTHNPSCFTSFGSRVDVHAYGSQLFSAGYGDQQNLAGCVEDYTNSFGGTSGASPIIVGVCASVQGIANEKWGFDLSPFEMRELIQVGGTPQGNATDHIGPMPDLANILPALAPDLVTTYTPSGWSGPIVARLSPDATGSAAITEAGPLPGNSTGTHWSWATRNLAAYTATTAATTTELTIDGEYLLGCSTAEYAPNQWRWCGNSGGAISIKGGRHTLRAEADYLFAQEEASEDNNSWAHQFIWSGLPLTSGVPVSRTSDPPASTEDFGPWYNGEGFSGTTETPYWYAFAVMPSASGEDFDIRLCVEEPANDPQQGFGSYVAYSSTPVDEIAYVLLDKNDVASGTYYASVLNFSDASANKLVEFAGDQGVLGSSGTFGPFTMDSGDLLEVHEAYLNGGSQTRIQIEVLSGSADFGISLHGGGDGFYDKASTVPGGTADAAGPGEDEWIIVEEEFSAYRGLVVWRKDPSQLNTSLTYNIIVGQSPNLIPTQPTGWYASIVPRNTTDASPSSVTLPAILEGNSTLTSFNWALANEGPNDASPSWSSVYVDDNVRFNSLSGTMAPGDIQYTNNTAQGFLESVVRGGRHHLRVTADRTEVITEFDEDDNSNIEWFVWTPEQLVNGSAITWPAPSPRDPIGFGPYYSGDGFRTSRSPSSYWTAVGIMPLGNGADYDVRMHEPSAGSKEGFGSYLAWSQDGLAGAPDFTIVNYNIAPGFDLDYSVINVYGTDDCVIQEADSGTESEIFPGLNDLGTFTLGPDEFMRIHEIFPNNAIVGLQTNIRVESVSGEADLDVRLFGANQEYSTKFSARASATSAGPYEDEVLGPIVFDTADYEAIVVHRNNSDDMGAAKQYHLYVDVPGISGVADDTAQTTLFLAIPHPNPTAGATQIQFGIPAGGKDVRVEVFDVRGRRLTVLADGPQEAGQHSFTWDGKIDFGQRVGAGIYFVRMTSGDFKSTQKIIMVR